MSGRNRALSYLVECRQLIENELQWADSSLWRHQEFLTLSDKILDKTGVALSVNTLKRLWGKVAYEHKPNATTLDALAKFVGYDNWMQFIASHEGLDQPDALLTPVERKPVTIRKRMVETVILEPIFAIGIMGLIMIISYDWWRFAERPLHGKAFPKIEFSSNKVVDGLPNTVIFNYNVSSVAAEQYFIQQSWDKRRRFQIDPTRREATSVYYYPGYWRAKILADTIVLSEHDLLVSSNGWLLTLDTEPRPRYFLPEDQALDSALSVDENIFEESIQGFKVLPWFTAHYVDDFDLEMDDLQLEFTVKNDYRSGLTPCQNIQIMALGSEGFFSVPLCNRGCIGEVRLRFSDKIKEGRDNNLSAFGRNMEQWQNLKIIVVDKNVNIYLDDTLVENLSYTESAGLFYGVRIKFRGQGYINSVRVKSTNDSGSIVDLFPVKSQ